MCAPTWERGEGRQLQRSGITVSEKSDDACLPVIDDDDDLMEFYYDIDKMNDDEFETEVSLIL